MEKLFAAVFIAVFMLAGLTGCKAPRHEPTPPPQIQKPAPKVQQPKAQVQQKQDQGKVVNGAKDCEIRKTN